MLQTILLFLALLCALVAILHLTNQYIASLAIHKDANTIPTVIFGILSIIFFCIFYYLN